jgi:hypothetical protein
VHPITNNPISLKLNSNIEELKNILGSPSDLIIRKFTVQKNSNNLAAVIFIDELIDKSMVNDFILRSFAENKLTEHKKIWQVICNNLVEIGEITEIDNFAQVIAGILQGDTALLVDGECRALLLGTKGWTTKSIGDPKIESLVRGPNEALNETMVISLSLIRRRLKDPKLRLTSFAKGTRSNTKLCLLYIEDIINPTILSNIREKLAKIKLDAILDTGYIEELVQDNCYSPFPQLQYTEKPDAVVAHLLEGKFAILVDGSPNALIAPAVFTQFYNTAEDYYERSLFSSCIRSARLVSLLMALFLPALYIAFVSFHTEMIPVKLALSVIKGRINVPFNSVLEILLMELGAIILNEASIRIPEPLGASIGIVGALILGNAVVSAGIVSPAVVIVVALTVIASYANPSYNASLAIRFVRILIALAAASLGLYGIALSTLFLLLHLLNLTSFDVPYLAPILPFSWSDLKDTWLRVPWTWMKKRPVIYKTRAYFRTLGGK